jgi:hypothetical protein
VESVNVEIPVFGKIVKCAHRIYKRKEIAPILNYLNKTEFPRGAIAKVHHDTGIPYSTLWDRREMRNRPGQANWLLFGDGYPAARVSDDGTEAFIIDCFKRNYIDHGIGRSRQALGSLSLNSCSSTPPNELKRDRFCTSSQLFRGLEKRHDLTMRRPQAQKRSEIDEAYLWDRMNALCEYSPLERVFNLDKTY